MYHVIVRFYEELNDFLPAADRKNDIDFEFKGRRSVKDLIESFGVPHVEVDLILVNGVSVDFSRIIEDGDRISVYPVFETFSIGPVTRLRPEPLRNPRFVIDVQLGKLARRLRLMGLDVDYHPDRDDAALADIADHEGRILLSRDRQLMMRKNVLRGLYVRNIDPAMQVIEVLDRLDLWDLCRPFTRCMECNDMIEHLELNGRESPEIVARIPPGVFEWCREYYRCRGCGRIYWKGSHYEKLKIRVEMIYNGR